MASTEYIDTAKTAYESTSPTEGSISATPITEPNTGYLDIKDKKPVPVKGELMKQHVTERGETCNVFLLLYMVPCHSRNHFNTTCADKAYRFTMKTSLFACLIAFS